jgi:hypothetical protein
MYLLFFILGFHLSASEGVSTTIDASRLNEVADWVENANYTLTTEIETIRKTSVTYQEVMYADLMNRVLVQSGSKPNEFMMRNILYRAQIVYASIKQVPSSPKRNVLARRFLEYTTAWALSLYEPDLNLIRKQREGNLTDELRGVQFAHLGVQWAEYMMSLYYLAPTNEIKFQLMKDTMGLMYNDINNDDAVKRILAPVSGAIASRNSVIPDVNSLAKKLQLIEARDLRRFIEQQLTAIKNILATYSIPVAAIREAPASSNQAMPIEQVSSGTNPYSDQSRAIIARCNTNSDEDVRAACLSVKAPKDQFDFCTKHAIGWQDQVACFKRQGEWSNYTNYLKMQEVASRCSQDTDTDVRHACYVSQASAEKHALCSLPTDWLSRQQCYQGTGIWKNYQFDAVHREIVRRCNNESDSDVRSACFIAKPSKDHFDFCKQQGKTWQEEVACLRKTGVWSNY